MKKILLISAGIVALSIGMARAEGEAPAAPVEKAKKEVKAPVAKPDLKDYTLTGTVKSVTNKANAVSYVLVTAEGDKINLPKGKTTDFSTLVDTKVKINAKGVTKTVYTLSTVVSCEKVEEAPAPAAQ